jgi:hypothetical protein
MQQASPHYLRGAVFGLAAVSIWAGWSDDAADGDHQSGSLGHSSLALWSRRSAPVADRDPARPCPSIAWEGLGSLGLSSGPARPMHWWWLSGCASLPPTMRGRSIQDVCHFSSR